MIRELFVPKKLFGRRLIAEKTVGISLESDQVVAALLHKQASGTTIEFLDRQVIVTSEQPYAQRCALALKSLYSRLPAHDNVTALAGASQVIFKELTLPLINIDKIRLVIEFELEEMLPFSLDEAVVDCIITQKVGKESTVLAAAIQQSDLTQTLDIFHAAGIEPQRITIDILALHDVLLQIPQYATLEGGTALVYIGSTESRIAFLEAGRLRLVRTISSGADTVDDVESFVSDIQFTLNAFTQKLQFYGDLHTVLLCGRADALEGLAQHIEKQLRTKAMLFDTQKLLAQGVEFTAKTDVSLNQATLSIGAALPAADNEHFDLRRKTFALVDSALQRKQVIAALGLLCTLALIVLGGGILQVRRLAHHASGIQQREVAKLQRLLSKAARETTDPSLQAMLKRAQRAKKLGPLLGQIKTITASEEDTWGALHARALPVREAMLLVTNLIDRTAFALTINTLTLSGGEGGSTDILVNGVLSPKQMGEEYSEYARFEQALGEDKESILELIDSSPGQIDEKQGGLGFSITLRKKGEGLA